MNTAARTIRTTPAGQLPTVESRKSKPIKWWAAIGAAFLILEFYVLSAWVTSDDFTRTPAGPTPVPWGMRAAIVALQVITIVWFIVFLHRLVVRPLRRDRRLSFDGILVLALFLAAWQDPLVNYAQNWVTYNSAILNFGSWSRHVPGWLAPNSNRFAEPILWTAPMYATSFPTMMIGACAVMRRAKQRWPLLGTAGLIGICLAFTTVALFAFEMLWMRTGTFAYAGAIETFTVFYGHYYQYPLYEAVLGGVLMTALACFRYFRDDHGRSVVERGLDGMRAMPRTQGVLRFLAVSGALNVMCLVLYIVPVQWFALHADPWPQDILNRSYLTNNLCGPGTDYACSGPGVPIPRPRSVHLTPSDTFARP